MGKARPEALLYWVPHIRGSWRLPLETRRPDRRGIRWRRLGLGISHAQESESKPLSCSDVEATSLALAQAHKHRVTEKELYGPVPHQPAERWERCHRYCQSGNTNSEASNRRTKTTIKNTEMPRHGDQVNVTADLSKPSDQHS